MASTTVSPMPPDDQGWPPEGLERVEHCPVCGSTERKRLYTGLTDRVFRCAPGRWDLYQCLSCRSAYLDPRPTPETIHMAYGNYYTHEPPRRRATEELTSLRRLMRAMANGYRNRRYGGKLQPASRLGGFVMPLLPHYRQALDRELRYLPPLEPGARLLDVGFGSGAFLMLAQRIGWQVSGVDPDPVAVANARRAGLDVREGGIEAFADAREQFDVITLSHVIEHVHNPVETLKHAYALLKKGGVLYIETPSIDAYGHGRFREHWRGLEVPRHLVMFNWASMGDLLKRIGFEEINRIPTATPYASLAGASRAIQNGRDPYASGRPRLVDKFVAIILSFSLIKDKKKSEFITLHALK